MKVWRIEDREGRGPYNRLFSKKEINTPLYEVVYQLRVAHMDMATHPGAIHDDLINHIAILSETYKEDKILFGFPSKELAIEWLGEFLTDLESVGFELKEFETNTYKIGKSGKQLVFLK